MYKTIKEELQWFRVQGRTQKTDSSVRTEVMTKMTVTDDDTGSYCS